MERTIYFLRKHFSFFCILFSIIVFNGTALAQSDNNKQQPVDYVNPLVGTLSSFNLSNGNTYPVISMPWGTNSWTPQTRKNGDGWQYSYNDYSIRGIKQTHQPSPWINDYGPFSLLPECIEHPIFNENARASDFSHRCEEVKPYMYRVYLSKYDTYVAIAPTKHAAVMDIEYPRYSTCQNRWLLIDGFDSNSQIRQIDNHTIVGVSRKNSGGVPANFANYFVIKTVTPISKVISKDTITSKGTNARMAILLGGSSSHQQIYIASSFISTEQAKVNLQEVWSKTFDTIAQRGRLCWNELLSRLWVKDSREDAKRIFYSNLYRCLLFPRDFSEVNLQGVRVHYSPFNGKVEKGYMFTDTGIWDSFRALFPLINLVYPDEASKMQQGLYNVYKESGFYPEWISPGHRDCMVGNNSASVVADGLLKGLCNDLSKKQIIKGLLYTANHQYPHIKSTGRLGYKYYNRLGYVPCDVEINESAARSLEYSYDDWCIYKALQYVHANDSLINLYKNRALNYKHLYDSSVGWMRGREKNGDFQKPFNPYKWGGVFTEGNAIHWTWSVFHDVQGLINLMGGDKAFIQRLDTVFKMPPLFDDSYYGFEIHEIREMAIAGMGNYAHGNEPVHHMIYLYDYAGAPYKAQYHIRQVMNRLYSAAPDGYCGDEDTGQMSAWYVFSALGFYPVTPASDEYAIGIPYFDSITLHIPHCCPFEIEAVNPTKDYIEKVEFCGTQYNKVYLTYQLLRNGGKMIFYIGDKPSQWGTKVSDRPYSFSNEINKK